MQRLRQLDSRHLRDLGRYRPRGNCPARSGFSLIELVIVILVIGILVAMLFPAIGNVQRTARNTQVVVDIKNLEKAIADFKLKFGMEPPSSFRICERANLWGTSTADRNSIAIFRQLWPQFDVQNTNLGDLNGDGDTNDVITLNGAECLLFFLGGPGSLNLANTSPAFLGFSANPQNPFAAGGSRVGPFFEFDAARLVRGTSAYQYCDPLPGQTAPYQYFSSYGGRGYDIADAIPGTMRSVYLKVDANWPDNNPNLTVTAEDLIPSAIPNTAGRAPGEYWNQKTFQIISPGADGDYGVGGVYRTEEKAAYWQSNPNEQYRSRGNRNAERDNITNFSGGVLGDPKPYVWDR